MQTQAASTFPAVPAGGSSVWALAGFALYVVIGAGSIIPTALILDPVLDALGAPAEAGLPGLSIRNAAHPIVWGLLVALSSAPIGRRLVGGLRISGRGNVLLGIGLGLAAITWFLIQEFVRARFQYVDSEYVGVSFFAWPAVVAIGLSGWAALAIPDGRARPLIACAILAAAALGIAILPSSAGAADGVEPGNVPLALAFVADVMYAVAAIIVVIRNSAPLPPSG